MTSTCLRLVILSDTHGHRDFEVPPGDVLIHAGDGCRAGELDDAREWAAFMAAQPHSRKLAIAGNHDRCFETGTEAAALMRAAGVEFMGDSGVDLEGLPVWGSPWQPWFFDWAFNLQRGPELAEKWALIPSNTDLLITHGPAQGVLDCTSDGQAVGCEALRDALRSRLRPRVHIFGHIHEGYGTLARDGLLSINASICTLSYQPTNPAVVVDLPLDRRAPARLVEP